MIGVFAYHSVVLSLTFHLNWNVLHPLRSMPSDAYLNLGLARGAKMCMIRWSDRKAKDDHRSSAMQEEKE